MDARLWIWSCSSAWCLLGLRQLMVQCSGVCLENLWKFLWMRNWSSVPTIQKLAWSLLLASLLEHLIHLKKNPYKTTPSPTSCGHKSLLFWKLWGVTVGFFRCRTTSPLPTPTTCWRARGAAPTCSTRWSTPSSAGSSRCRSSASPSSTATSCSAKGASGKRSSGHLD